MSDSPFDMRMLQLLPDTSTRGVTWWFFANDIETLYNAYRKLHTALFHVRSIENELII